jgi:hypothetical protein
VVVVVVAAVDAVTEASLSWTLAAEGPDWARAVAPTATPAAAPTPTANCTQRRLDRDGTGARAPAGVGSTGGITGTSFMAPPLGLASTRSALCVTVRLVPVVELWISTESAGQSPVSVAGP